MVRQVIDGFRQIRIKNALGKYGTGFHIGKGASLINANNISVGENFRAGNYVKLQTWPIYRGKTTGHNSKIIIGDNVSFMDNVHVTAVDQIIIGDGVLLGDNVFISDNSHGNPHVYNDRELPPLERDLMCSGGGIAIGKNVWIGRNACIIGCVSIGDGAIIGANSVVTKNIPALSTVVGVPAKVINAVCESQTDEKRN